MPPRASSNGGSRINWLRSGLRCHFIELCLNEVDVEGYLGNSLKPISWEQIGEEIKKHDPYVTPKKLRNQRDYIKGQYIDWRVLEKRSGAGWDAQKNTFSFPSDVWNELKLEVAQFKDKGLEDRELLQSMFEARFATGDDRFTPISEPTEATQGRDEVSYVVDDAFNDQGLDQMPDTYFSEYSLDTSPVNQEGPYSDARPESDAGSSKLSGKRRKREVDEDSILKTMGELMGYIKRQTLGDEQTTDEAMAQVDEMRELGHITREEVENALIVFSLRPNQMRIFIKPKDMDRNISFFFKK